MLKIAGKQVSLAEDMSYAEAERIMNKYPSGKILKLFHEWCDVVRPMLRQDPIACNSIVRFTSREADNAHQGACVTDVPTVWSAPTEKGCNEYLLAMLKFEYAARNEAQRQFKEAREALLYELQKQKASVQ